MKPHLILRADMAVALTLWVCQSTDDERRLYRAASAAANVTQRLNTSDLRKAARFPTKEAAERACGMDYFSERWRSAEAPPAQYECLPESECAECHGVCGSSTYGHARWDCALLLKVARERATARKEVSA